jgi:hypothetical protein
LLGKIIHTLPTVGAFPGKMESGFAAFENAVFNFLTQRRPRQPDVPSLFHFLTAGTRGGNCAYGYLRACAEIVFRSGTETAREPRLPGTEVRRNQSRVPRLIPCDLKKEIAMSNPNEKPGQQNQNPGQKPGQQQGGGQKPGQQQQDPSRKDQKPSQGR